ncbi:hypothetical protein DAETH_38120 (plasmid) [Deinococcus aetherius]|uniref:N-acetyltransferase domain-containing protein n=2 Tax=Deinococcus aetherius TaxID=200252 RepID=A0ABN6RKK2_9DEIO|nr:hypothetical protein DAETH_38120 [Deinococcus aetherius]
MFSPQDAGVVDRMMTDYFGGARDEGHLCLIDEEEGTRGVAYVLPVTATEGTWELLMIAVRPGLQGQGRGGALLRRVEDDLRSQGGRLLLVQTSGTPDFARTRAFYAKSGYEQEARVRDYYAPGVDMILFRKALTAPGDGPG